MKTLELNEPMVEEVPYGGKVCPMDGGVPYERGAGDESWTYCSESDICIEGMNLVFPEEFDVQSL